MSQWLLKLMGVWSGESQRIVRVAPDLHTSIPGWLLLMIAIALCYGVVWTYKQAQGDFPARRRWIMAALRCAFLLLVLLMLLQPVLSITTAGSVRQQLVVMVDTSNSMKIEDMREGDDLTRAAIVSDAAKASGGLSQKVSASGFSKKNPARLDVIKKALTSGGLDLLPHLADDYDLEVCTFDETIHELPMKQVEGKTATGTQTRKASPAESLDWVNKLQATGKVTAIGDCVRDMILRKRGQPIAGIVVISDFANNSGSVPLEAAKMAADETVPLYTYGVGTTAPRDIIVSSVLAPDTAFVNDELPVTVQIRSQRFAKMPVKVQLMAGGKELASSDIVLEDGEQTVTVTYTPTAIGELNLQAQIAPQPDEVVTDNNISPPKHVRVIDSHIKVLHIETQPRWDFKYLQALLMRDRRVEYHAILLDGDPSITQAPGSPFLKEFPTLKDLGNKYDLVVIGDVDPKRMPKTFMTDLQEFISRLGGSLVVVAGHEFTPQAFKGTPIEKMLPVEFDAPKMQPAGQSQIADKPLKLELTPQGKSSLMLKLADKQKESDEKWAQFPPIYWDARVLWAKPGADTLIVDADPAKASRFGKMPVVALQQYGLGQVLYIGTDNTWRWRKNKNDSAFTTIWGQVVDRLSMPHMLGAKRTQLNADREKYTVGDRVVVYARLYRADSFDPVTDLSVRGFYRMSGASATDQREHEVILRSMPDQKGMYRTEFVVTASGTYTFGVETDNTSRLDFLVSDSNVETGETALNLGLLKEMATTSGGVAMREEDLYKLPQLVKNTSQPVLSKAEVDLWSSPLYFLILLILVTVEWVLRKLSYLK